MNLKEISKLIHLQVQHNIDCGKDDKFTILEIEDIIKRKVINMFEPNDIYEKEKFYEGLGYYIGVVDTYPYAEDFFIRNHHFRTHRDCENTTPDINQVFIRKIKK